MYRDDIAKCYEEDDLLPLSGLQHFVFCRRQWALIHIEDQWRENLRTVEGSIVHERAHQAKLTEKRGDVIISRGMPVRSYALGLNGVCDVVEFHRAPDGVSIALREGAYLPIPVEYKRGRPKEHQADEIQLCAQAMCLEEMLCCSIEKGYLYYDELKRRTAVPLDAALRGSVQELSEQMHQYFKRRYTPKVRPSKSCNACSLKEICLPKLCRPLSAAEYIRQHIEESDDMS